MATRKFIKMYGIHDSDIDDKGNVNPDASLYPYYDDYEEPKTGLLYHALSPDQIDDKLSDIDREYDNSTNSYPDRIVHFLGSDDSTIAEVGPNLKRGYSALAYGSPEKRHGDDYFDDWGIDDDAEEEVHTARHITPEEFERRTHVPGFSYGNYTTAERDSGNLSGMLESNREDSIYRIPLIVEADDSDIINYNDVVNNNYDPTRDYIPEVQLKRIIKKSVIPNAITTDTYANAKQKALSNLRVMAAGLTKYASEAPQKYIAASNGKDLQKVIQLAMASIRNYADQIYSFINAIRDIDTLVPGFSYSTHSNRTVDYYDIIEAAQQYLENLSECESIHDCAEMVLGYFDFAKAVGGTCAQRLLKKVSKVLTSPSSNNSHIIKQVNPDVMKKATQKGGAFDWYDRSTYSDERLKDIYGDCRDVTLSDKQLKYIYDDFSKFKKGATQSNITKGLRGLGQ